MTVVNVGTMDTICVNDSSSAPVIITVTAQCFQSTYSKKWLKMHYMILYLYLPETGQFNPPVTGR